MGVSYEKVFVIGFGYQFDSSGDTSKCDAIAQGGSSTDAPEKEV
jgi:hypothetical protein